MTRRLKERVVSLTSAVILTTLLTATGALAQQPADKSQLWQFGASIYGWFPDITGQTAFTQPGGGNEFEIDIDTILDNLEFTLMGSFDVHKGRWGLLTDMIYMDVGNSKSGTRQASIGGNPLPVDATADVDLDLKSWIWTLVGYYRALEQTGLSLDVVFGARYLDIEQRVNWEISGNVSSIPIPDRTGDAKASLSNWDAIFGARGRFAFGSKKAWFVPFYFDLGAGDSDFTWQGVAGLGYAFRWVEVEAVWRHLYYDFSGDSAINDMSLSGPAIGVTFRW